MMLHGVALPDGWLAERLVHNSDCVKIAAPTTGYLMMRVTVDFGGRCFRVGLNTTGPVASSRAYRGQGWRGALVADAVKHLEGARRFQECAIQ